MPPQPPLFHSLLRPCVLQILRAQGYYAARPSVVDTLTDMAARYLMALCEATARHTAHNSTELTGLVPSVVDVRMALEDCGALATPAAFEGPQWLGDDTRSVDEFVDWVCGPRNREIKRVALDGDDENTDYLSVLKKKHSKTGEDSKYSGTVLGRGTEHGDVVVEGGDFPSIASWQEKRSEAREQPRLPTPSPTPPPPPPSSSSSSEPPSPSQPSQPSQPSHEPQQQQNHHHNHHNNNHHAEGNGRHSRTPSSGLSSIGDRSIDEDMEIKFAAEPS